MLYKDYGENLKFLDMFCSILLLQEDGEFTTVLKISKHEYSGSSASKVCQCPRVNVETHMDRGVLFMHKIDPNTTERLSQSDINRKHRCQII